MSIRWHFSPALPAYRTRESQVGKFFNSDAVESRANAMVREGTQNTLDAGLDDGSPAEIRIAVGEWPKNKTNSQLPLYMAGFDKHFAEVRASIANAPITGEPFRYLVFEDFGTSGLVGDPEQWCIDGDGNSNPFFNYFRAEGVSNKEKGNRGRHGVGKFVFARASRIRAMFGLTRRADNRELLMGTCVLRNHRVGGQPYLPDGWYGLKSEKDEGLVLPVEHDHAFIDRFKTDFGITRKNKSGLSVVVPWLDTEATADKVIEAVIRGYFHPIMRGTLIVEVSDESGNITKIGAANIQEITGLRGDEFKNEMCPILDLAEASLSCSKRITLNPPPAKGAPKWDAECIPEAAKEQIPAQLESGDVVDLVVPMSVRLKDQDAKSCSFSIFMLRDPALSEGQIIFIREGIIITDVRPKRTSGIRGLVIIDDSPLATFLGDAENPSHTEWQKALVKDKYSFWAANIEYVVQSIWSILRLISDEQKKADPSLLIDLFSLPEESDASTKAKQKKKRKEDGADNTPPVDAPPAKPKRYAIHHTDDGFVIRRGAAATERPSAIEVKVAYDVRRGGPLAKYNPADFKLNKNGVEVEITGAQTIEIGDNFLVAAIDDDDFEIRFSGLDTNRDLHVDTRVVEMETIDAQTV